MNRKTTILLLTTVLMLSLGAAVWLMRAPDGGGATLTVYCAAGMKKPVDAAAAAFEKETGVRVSLQYGGTGTLLTQLQVAKQGDLFIAADDGSLADAAKKELTREVLPIAVQHPVIAVAKGNPRGIASLDDLMKDGVKFALPNPDAASIGKVSRALLGARWEALAAKAAVMKPTVTEVAADVVLGAVDAALVWDSVVPQFKELAAVEVAEFSKHRENASAAVLTFCTQPATALQFARYLTAPEKGGEIVKQHGFQPAGGDAWSAKPEMVLYSGGVNRPAIEKLVQDFADREGISVTTVFNGCGILCAAMKAMGDSTNPRFPDAYYACDVCFVPPVAEHFPEAVLLTETEIIIATQKGNPKNIKTLADLAQPGLKLGICNAEQSTLGFMTDAILRSMNLRDSVMKNVAVQVPTADFLVNQMRAGALDAAIVYQVSVQQVAEHFDTLPLPADKAKAVQPFAVRKDSAHRQLALRLLKHLRAHRETFENAGFIWTGDSEPVKSSDLVIPEHLKN
jgi:molybdate transport system substrate-binding protein